MNKQALYVSLKKSLKFALQLVCGFAGYLLVLFGLIKLLEGVSTVAVIATIIGFVVTLLFFLHWHSSYERQLKEVTRNE